MVKGLGHFFVLIFNQLNDGDGSECRNGKIRVVSCFSANYFVISIRFSTFSLNK